MTSYSYTPRNRLLSETRTLSGARYTFNYAYDTASNLLQLTYPDGYHLNYTYDQLNRIIAVGPLATLVYRLNDEISMITHGSGVETAYSYDKLGRVTRIRTWNSTAALLKLNYVYAANGNSTSVNNGQESYSYDDLRLISASEPFGTLSYKYDQVGNRLSETVNGTQTTYTYGSYNKLLSAGSAQSPPYGMPTDLILVNTSWNPLSSKWNSSCVFLMLERYPRPRVVENKNRRIVDSRRVNDRTRLLPDIRKAEYLGLELN